MRTVHIAEPADADRADAEAFIQDIYGREYGARIAQFAPRILCRTGPEGDLRCDHGRSHVEEDLGDLDSQKGSSKLSRGAPWQLWISCG